MQSEAQLAKDNFLSFQASLPSCPTHDQFLQEEALSDALSKALVAEETFLKQKSIISWLEKGDGNIGFFFKRCNGRWNHNKILLIRDDNGVEHTTHREISEVAVSYYQKLLGTSTQVQPISSELQLPTL